MTHNYKNGTTLGGDAVRLTLSKVVTLCIAMLYTMLLSRFRSLQEYGTYSQLLLVINLVSSLLMLGLPNSINYFLARAESQAERRSFLSLYYVISTIISIVIGLVLVVSVPLIESYFKNDTIRSFCYFLALFPWARIISSSVENVLVVYKQTKNLVVFRFFYSLATLATVVVVQWLELGFSAFMVAFIAVNCLLTISVYYIAFHLCEGFFLSYNPALIRAIFNFSIPMGLAAIIGTLNIEIDKLLIGYCMDTEQLAIYTNAAKELPLAIVASSITAVLLPQLTRLIKQKKTEEAIALWGYATELSLIVMSVVIFGIFTFAEEAMTILYSAKYLPGISVFRVYTLLLLLRITYFGMVLNAYGKSKKIFYCSILSLLLNVILNPLFYWLFGMLGPAIATLLALLAILPLQLKMTATEANVAFVKLFPWERFLEILVINVFFSIVFWKIKLVLPIEQYVNDVVEGLLLGAVWCFLYLAVMRQRIIRVWHLLNANGGD